MAFASDLDLDRAVNDGSIQLYYTKEMIIINGPVPLISVANSKRK